MSNVTVEKVATVQQVPEPEIKPSDSVVIAPALKCKVPEEIMQKTAALLELDRRPVWGISDYDPENQLVLVRYIIEEDKERCTPAEARQVEMAQPGSLGWLRGVVVDLRTGAIVCRSFPYTQTITLNKLQMTTDRLLNTAKPGQRSEKQLVFMGDSFKYHSFKYARIQRGYEGLVIRVFKHHGQVYFSSHRRLSIEKFMMAGQSRPAAELYQELGGPTPEELFSEAPYSPFVHLFVICHPDLIYTSREEINQGYLVYLGHRRMDWFKEKPYPYPEAEVEMEPRKVPAVRHLTPDGPRIILPEILSSEGANRHILGEGNPTRGLDPRLSGGGFVIVTCLNNDERMEAERFDDPVAGRHFRIQGCGQTWRDGIVNGSTNPRNQYCQLLDQAQKLYSQGASVYHEVFPQVPIPAKFTHDPPLINPTGVLSGLRDPKVREKHVLTCLMLALPFHRQKEAVEALTHLHQTRRIVGLAIEDVIASLNKPLPSYLVGELEELRKKAKRQEAINDLNTLLREVKGKFKPFLGKVIYSLGKVPKDPEIGDGVRDLINKLRVDLPFMGKTLEDLARNSWGKRSPERFIREKVKYQTNVQVYRIRKELIKNHHQSIKLKNAGVIDELPLAHLSLED